MDALNLLGLIYHREQRYEESVHTFQKALEFDPRSVKTLNNLAASYAAEQKLDLAEQTFRQTLHWQPRNRTANYNLGLILLKAHRPKQAIQALELVQPPDPSTLLNLAKAFLRAGSTSRGLATAERLSMRNPKDVKVHFSLGVLLAFEQNYGRQSMSLRWRMPSSLIPSKSFTILVKPTCAIMNPLRRSRS